MTHRLIVLGATGQLGRIVMEGLASRDDLDLVGQSRTARPGYAQWSPEDGQAALGRLVDGADTVLNLIGTTPAGAPSLEAFHEINCALARQIAGTCLDKGVARVLLASSAAVYGKPPSADHVFDENDPLGPLSDYARSKVAMEEMVAELADPRLCVVRIGNVAGADALLSQLVNGRDQVEITLHSFASGKGPLRSYIGPQTLADSIAALALAPNVPACLNITAHAPVAMDDLLEAWNLRQPDRVTLTKVPAPEGAIERVVLSHARLNSLMGAALGQATAQSLVDETLSQRFTWQCAQS